MHLPGHIVGRVAGQDGTFGLEDSRPPVILFVDEVDGDAAFPFAGLHHRAVHTVAIHALASVFGKQSRVDVDNTARISLNQRLRHAEQESGQDDEIDAPLLHQAGQLLPPGKLLARERQGGNVQVGRTHKHVSVWFVRHDKGDIHVFVALEMADDVFGIRPRTRSENSNVLLHIYPKLCTSAYNLCKGCAISWLIICS